MPNDVATHCIVTGPASDVDKFRREMIIDTFDEEGNPKPLFDFNKIIPQPAIIQQTQASSTSVVGAMLIVLRADGGSPIDPALIKRLRRELGMPSAKAHKVAAAYLAKHPEYETEGRLRLRALLETGYPDWLFWRTANWGTKWNSYRFKLINDNPLEFAFVTAWSFPLPVFEALAREYSTLEFDCLTIEESGAFKGRGCFNPSQGKEPFGFYGSNNDRFCHIKKHSNDKHDLDKAKAKNRRVKVIKLEKSDPQDWFDANNSPELQPELRDLLHTFCRNDETTRSSVPPQPATSIVPDDVATKRTIH